MSFRCDNCGTSRPAGERPVKVITAKRLKHYSDSFGSETEREVNIGQCCADQITEASTPVPWDSDNTLRQPVGELPGYEAGRVNKHFADKLRG